MIIRYIAILVIFLNFDFIKRNVIEIVFATGIDWSIILTVVWYVAQFLRLLLLLLIGLKSNIDVHIREAHRLHSSYILLLMRVVFPSTTISLNRSIRIVLFSLEWITTNILSVYIGKSLCVCRLRLTTSCWHIEPFLVWKL